MNAPESYSFNKYNECKYFKKWADSIYVFAYHHGYFTNNEVDISLLALLSGSIPKITQNNCRRNYLQFTPTHDNSILIMPFWFPLIL